MATRTIVRFVFLAITLIAALPGTELAGGFQLPQELINFLFPKDSGVVRVRNLGRARALNNVEILNFVGLVERHGYPAEEHDVVTEDGYKLKVHRIPDSPLSSNKRNKKVVFLQHGIIASSDTWVFFGPGRDLAFLLADEGYDVWLGNFRGNTYSKSHVKMSPQDADFWQFSYHEFGQKDLPAMIDYALNYTGQKDLIYIGHSMGTSSLFVLLSTKPEYNLKIRLGVCLAPIAFWKELSPILRSIIRYHPQLIGFFNANHINEVLSLTSNTIATGRVLCADKAITQTICVTLMFLIAGSDPAQINTTALPEIFTYYPAGASVRTLHHYYQNIITRDFRSFDEGGLTDYEQYQRTTKYNLKNVVAPLVLFYGANDAVNPRENVLAVYQQLPNVVLMEEVPYKQFTHLDFLWANDAKSLLYDHLIDTIRKFEGEDRPPGRLFWPALNNTW